MSSSPYATCALARLGRLRQSLVQCPTLPQFLHWSGFRSWAVLLDVGGLLSWVMALRPRSRDFPLFFLVPPLLLAPLSPLASRIFHLAAQSSSQNRCRTPVVVCGRARWRGVIQ